MIFATIVIAALVCSASGRHCVVCGGTKVAKDVLRDSPDRMKAEICGRQGVSVHSAIAEQQGISYKDCGDQPCYTIIIGGYKNGDDDGADAEGSKSEDVGIRGCFNAEAGQPYLESGTFSAKDLEEAKAKGHKCITKTKEVNAIAEKFVFHVHICLNVCETEGVDAGNMWHEPCNTNVNPSTGFIKKSSCACPLARAANASIEASDVREK